MWPTLRPFDRFHIETTGPHSALRVGDVILFAPPEEAETQIIHRISRITSASIQTRGDNGSVPDKWVLNAGQVIGRVVWVSRGKRKIPVHGGLRGAIYARLIWRAHSLVSFLYLRLARLPLLKTFILRLVRFKPFQIDADRYVVHLILGAETIGRYSSADDEIRISKFYKPLFDDRGLQRCRRRCRNLASAVQRQPAWDGGAAPVNEGAVREDLELPE